MRKLTILVVVLVAVAFVSAAFAVPPGKDLTLEASMGAVTFSGKVHKDAGLGCADCHSKIFKMKAGSFKMSVADHGDKFCGTCHNGEKAFNTKGNCAKCHKK